MSSERASRRTTRTRTRTTTRVTRVSGGDLDPSRGVFMISVAAELADMHPQTLRMYEQRGLITPKRSPKNTRLYSQEDVERLRRIQEMTADQGLNLAGVETVLELEEKLQKTRKELARMRERAAEMEQQMTVELDRVRRSLGGDLVPYGQYESEKIEPPTEGDGEKRRRVRVRVERSRRPRSR